ncbi:phosphoglycerate mutase [Dongia mobilis]|uniref:2,3-bisphosphoglycerate-independent phosphoglycerate mutase n=1 Tax=Dongia mobilis TaxID=578943 RepID=A0A4R6X0L2_9PROT|nr:2,3-bisphosphoglycerate-independent phosphoglycerate mutase [Dongia mobilis]TDQ83988.1 phosphoglycerate mutase [Dongia mobilis]
MKSTQIKPVVLCILDGWGHRHEQEDNAVLLAETPNWDQMTAAYPWSLVDASELYVGLPEGQMGNSEVGHMNLGAGRVVMQDLPRIDRAIADGSIAKLPELEKFVAKMRASKGDVQLMGLLSPGGVHSHQDHMVALARVLSAAGLGVVIHGFLDGRDTPPQSARGFVADFEAKIANLPNVRIGTLGGRYYAMDRDKRWERVTLAYDAFHGEAPRVATAQAAIAEAYLRGETDEFVKPTLIGNFPGFRQGDGLLMANFRADRARQLLTTLIDPGFKEFPRKKVTSFAAVLGMVEYSAELAKLMPCLFPPVELTRTLGEIVADHGMKQLRMAETEKYAHVTFFFNGGEEGLFPGEERILVPSPKVATYDLMPEMSAYELTDKLVDAIQSEKFDLIVVNYANGDMVGHSGNLAAAVKAVEVVDACLGRVRDAVVAKGGALLITADHGNCEMMKDPVTGEPHTAHTLNRVPFILVNAPAWAAKLKDGRLADVAPTILALLGITQPREMTGESLIMGGSAQQREDASARA